MEKKDFFNYAMSCNDQSQGYDNEDIAQEREARLKNVPQEIVDVADVLDKEHFKMSFMRCLNGKFCHYNYNWAQIYIKNIKTYMLFCDGQREAELLYQLWRKFNIIIIRQGASIEDIKGAIIEKMRMLERRREEMKQLKAKKKMARRHKQSHKPFHKRPRIGASAYSKNYNKREYNNFKNNNYGRQ